jgi:hypothetical protein
MGSSTYFQAKIIAKDLLKDSVVDIDELNTSQVIEKILQHEPSVIFLDSLKKEIELADIVIKQKTKDFYEIEVPELKKQFFEENVAKTPNASLSFNESTKTLSNSSGKMTPEITGQSLRLLKCFLESPDYKCKRNTIIQTMGGEHQHSGAKNSLKSLLQGVAKIESIRNKSNAREVEFMQLVSE